MQDIWEWRTGGYIKGRKDGERVKIFELENVVNTSVVYCSYIYISS